MPYIKPEMRTVVDPHIDKVVERACRRGDVTPERLGAIVQGFLVCVYQEELPRVERECLANFDIDVAITRDLVRALLESFSSGERWGVMNYCVCKLILKTVLSEKVCYNKLQAVVEVLVNAEDMVGRRFPSWMENVFQICTQPLRALLRCVEHEIYRRVVAPYEDTKIACEENGDVF